MNVAAIVPTFERDVTRILRCFRDQTYADKRLYLIDNNPEKLSLSETGGVVHVWQQGTNVGASGGRNIGMDYARRDDCDAICFWDDDDEPFTEYLEKMTAMLVLSDNGVVACQCMFGNRMLSCTHVNTVNRMVRADVIGEVRWTNEWPGQDKRFWSQLPPADVHLHMPMIHAGAEQGGGFRSERAVKV